MPPIGASAVGVALLASGDTQAARAAAPLLGFEIGAKIDWLGHFKRHYSSLTAYSTVFAWIYGIGLFASSVAMVMASLLCLSMGRYLNISEA